MGLEVWDWGSWSYIFFGLSAILFILVFVVESNSDNYENMTTMELDIGYVQYTEKWLKPVADNADIEYQRIVIAESAPPNGLEKREHTATDESIVVQKGDLVMLTTNARIILKLRNGFSAAITGAGGGGREHNLRQLRATDESIVVQKGDLVMLTTNARIILKLRRMVFPPLSLEREEEDAEHNLRQLREEHPELLSSISVGQVWGNEDYTDEYEGEAATIITRLRACSSAAELRTVAHEEFVLWFGPYDPQLRSDYEHAENVAEMILDAWQSYENQ